MSSPFRLLSFLLATGWLAACSGTQGQVLSAIGQNFTGSTWGVDSFALPPDPNGAVGPEHFVEFINGRFSVYAKTNGLRILTKGDHSFWNSAGVSLPTGFAVSDPRILFDPSAQRWFASAVDYNVNQTSNHFLLAISSSADPTASWSSVAFISDPAQGQFADFPTLGLDVNAVCLGGDMFSGPTGGELGANTLVSIPKADLLGTNPVPDNRTWFGILDGARYGYVLQPIVNFDDPAGDGHVLAIGDLGHDFLPHSTMVAFTVHNAATPAATLASPTALSVDPYSVPLNPPQPDGINTLDDGDTRLSAMVRQVGGIIYATHSIQVSGRASIRWYKFHASDLSLRQSGTITDPNLDYFFPSIAANAAGTVVIGFNGCSLNSFISCYAVVGGTVDGLTSFGTPLLLKAGQASYERLVAGGISRWGDYSATCLDPADPNRFWTIQMFPANTNVWATQIIEILTAVPMLSIAQSGTALTLSWPGSAIPFALESTPNLVSPSWAAVGPPPALAAPGIVSVQLSLPAAPLFFRLRRL